MREGGLVNERPHDVADVVLGRAGELAKGMGRETKIGEATRIANVGQLDGDGLVPV